MSNASAQNSLNGKALSLCSLINGFALYEHSHAI